MKFAVIGDPIAHSKSPVMHASAYRALGMNHSYEAIRARAAELSRYVAEVRSGALDGMNVTVPHKEAILELVDDVDESARIVSAANTLVRRTDADGHVKVVAYNTDVPALAEEIRALAPEISAADWARAAGIVIGSGGAARSAACALARFVGAGTVIVRARAFEKDAVCTLFRNAVAPALGRATLITAPLSSESTEQVGDVLAVIQATSAGMTGKDDGEAIARSIDFSALPRRAVALDVVYAPPRTPFIVAAETAGIRASNGLGMLARQGALAFELWLGVHAPYSAMLSAIV